MTNFQNYYRADIRTPVQHYPVSAVVAPSSLHKGDLTISGTLARSGDDEKDPRENYWEKDGSANLTNYKGFGTNASYAISDYWMVNAHFGSGQGKSKVDINEYSQTVGAYDPLLVLLTLGLYDGTAPAAVPIRHIETVEREYKYWDAAIGAGYYLPSTKKRLSLHFGVSKGGANLTGTTHADDKRIYSTDRNAPPATYGVHRNIYTGLSVQPGFRLSNPENRWVNLGVASKLMYYHSRVNSNVFEIQYAESLDHLLLQPSAYVALGPKQFKLLLAYSYLAPLVNPTREHFNRNYLHAGLQIMIPTLSASKE